MMNHSSFNIIAFERWPDLTVKINLLIEHGFCGTLLLCHVHATNDLKFYRKKSKPTSIIHVRKCTPKKGCRQDIISENAHTDLQIISKIKKENNLFKTNHSIIKRNL